MVNETSLMFLKKISVFKKIYQFLFSKTLSTKIVEEK